MTLSIAAGVTEVGMYSSIWTLSVGSASEGAGETLPVPGSMASVLPLAPGSLGMRQRREEAGAAA